MSTASLAIAATVRSSAPLAIATTIVTATFLNSDVFAAATFLISDAADGLHSWMILKCSVDYATITLQLCEQKKNFMFYYRNIIYVGIVRFDVYPTNSPSNKQHHHGEPFATTVAWLKQIGSPHPRGPLRKGSSEVAVKGF
jgi:hypothetical protein